MAKKKIIPKPWKPSAAALDAAFCVWLKCKAKDHNMIVQEDRERFRRALIAADKQRQKEKVRG